MPVLGNRGIILSSLLHGLNKGIHSSQGHGDTRQRAMLVLSPCEHNPSQMIGMDDRHALFGV